MKRRIPTPPRPIAPRCSSEIEKTPAQKMVEEFKAERKQRRRNIITIYLVLGMWITVYLLMSFVFLSFDPETWGEPARIATAALSLFLSGFIVINRG